MCEFVVRRWDENNQTVREHFNGNEAECYRWLHRNCSSSWQWAIENEGWEIVSKSFQTMSLFELGFNFAKSGYDFEIIASSRTITLSVKKTNEVITYLNNLGFRKCSFLPENDSLYFTRDDRTILIEFR